MFDFDILGRKLSDMDGTSLVVGVQSGSGENFHGDMITADKKTLKIARAHEYGVNIKVTPKMRNALHYIGIHLKKSTTHIHIPERSYIRRAFEEGQIDFNKAMNENINLFFEGNNTAEELLSKLGKQAVTDVVGNVGVDTTPISDVAKEQRKKSKSSTPLIDTGHLQNHITFRIIKGGM